jgi:uncharacterized protein (DUF433 family)
MSDPIVPYPNVDSGRLTVSRDRIRVWAVFGGIVPGLPTTQAQSKELTATEFDTGNWRDF